MRSSRRVVTTVAAVALLLTGCSDPEAGNSGDFSGPIRLYGSDGVMQDGLGAALGDPALLTGMKGTAPQNPLPTEFRNRMLELDSSLGQFQYAGETYDAVVISALAAELAGTPDPEVVRQYVNSVTAGGQRCNTAAACLELARAGEDLEYRGVSMRGGFTNRGEPATASYATMHFSSDGNIDAAKTEFVGAGDLTAITAEEPPDPGPRPETPSFQTEPLRLGELLPRSGPLAEPFYGAMGAAAELAVEEINDAGGVFGVDVEWLEGDDGSFDVAVAQETFAAHVADDVHIVIGPATSDTTEALLPEAVARQRILFSPSSTRADLSTADHDGYFFRTAPPDDLQGAALADVVLRDGGGRIAIVAQDGVYGRGLQENVRQAFARFGVPESELTLLTYEPPASAPAIPDAEVRELVERIEAATPQAVVLIGFGEAAQIVQGMADAGLPLAP